MKGIEMTTKEKVEEVTKLVYGALKYIETAEAFVGQLSSVDYDDPLYQALYNGLSVAKLELRKITDYLGHGIAYKSNGDIGTN